LGGFQDWTETTTFGEPALSRYDVVVDTARRHGLQVLGLLSNEAWHGFLVDWQANNAETAGGNGDNDYLRELAEQAAVVLVQHFAGRVERWEVWNEPNAAPTYLYPSNFAWLLARVYAAVRASGAPVQLISGGVSTVQATDGSLTGASTGADYLRATYARGKELAGWEELRAAYGSYPLDAIGQHLYVDGYRRTRRETIRTALQLVRDGYVEGEGGDGTKPTIVTEVGWASRNVSERTQADNLQAAFAELLATPWVQTASWFYLRDDPAANLAFGLLRPDGSEKPAWQGYLVVTVPETPPLPPAGLSASGFAVEVRLDWLPNTAPDLAGYHVARAAAPGGPFTRLTTAPLTGPSFVDAGVALGQAAYYQVTAVDTLGFESAPSVTVGAMRGDATRLAAFERTWARTDRPVAESATGRTWMWGAQPFSYILTERYEDAPGDFRQVQYFDKARMELTDPTGDPNSIWYVTNGLLVVELMSGWMQVGDSAFVEREPAAVNVAGDRGSGPTYAALSPLRWASAAREGDPITRRVSADGTVTVDAGLAARGVTAAHFVPETRHTVARPFWDFMNSSGLVDEDGRRVTEKLFENPFYATGFPITEAYWTQVTLAGVPHDVLVQCFQRRCLTYTPDNPAGWQVEAGNVGQHYYTWRYGALPEW
jgi:hypothetical protein